MCACATAWDDYSGSTYTIKIQQALCMGDRGMNHSLLNPNQLRVYGVEVQDNPFEPVQCHVDTGFDNVITSMFAQGIIIFTYTRLPTEEELITY